MQLPVCLEICGELTNELNDNWLTYHLPSLFTGSRDSQSGRERRERRSSLIVTPTPERRSVPVPSSRETTPTPTATASTPGDQPQPFVRRRSARHRNYLNRGHLHQAVQLDGELPEGYGKRNISVVSFKLLEHIARAV